MQCVASNLLITKASNIETTRGELPICRDDFGRIGSLKPKFLLKRVIMFGSWRSADFMEMANQPIGKFQDSLRAELKKVNQFACASWPQGMAERACAAWAWRVVCNSSSIETVVPCGSHGLESIPGENTHYASYLMHSCLYLGSVCEIFFQLAGACSQILILNALNGRRSSCRCLFFHD